MKQSSDNSDAMSFLTSDTPIGRLLIAGSEHGLSFVALRDDEHHLLHALQAHIPAGQPIQRNDWELRSWLEMLLRYFRGEQQIFDIALDIHGTPFQMQVWETLQTIPYGETRSYQDIAHMLNKPKAVRAVAHACGANPVSLVIPCHRVIRSDGSLGGYGGGIERKRALLQLEQTFAL
jgi:AraC family transcriptional regulator of adaptative response/methylated-DNA-[protein]-cysteine methyltransferase